MVDPQELQCELLTAADRCKNLPNKNRSVFTWQVRVPSFMFLLPCGLGVASWLTFPYEISSGLSSVVGDERELEGASCRTVPYVTSNFGVLLSGFCDKRWRCCCCLCAFLSRCLLRLRADRWLKRLRISLAGSRTLTGPWRRRPLGREVEVVVGLQIQSVFG